MAGDGWGEAKPWTEPLSCGGRRRVRHCRALPAGGPLGVSLNEGREISGGALEPVRCVPEPTARVTRIVTSSWKLGSWKLGHRMSIPLGVALGLRVADGLGRLGRLRDTADCTRRDL